jgi:hypothetical protein
MVWAFDCGITLNNSAHDNADNVLFMGMFWFVGCWMFYTPTKLNAKRQSVSPLVLPEVFIMTAGREWRIPQNTWNILQCDSSGFEAGTATRSGDTTEGDLKAAGAHSSTRGGEAGLSLLRSLRFLLLD